jgi:exonuclease SbcC
MNLIRIHIENFKQFVDPLDIEIPQDATIGVIGANGVGKTTLFQAIEWCLYNPNSISARDIRPRGRTGNPKVSITLEARDGSKRWVVEREVKRSSATAAVYEVEADGSETLVVQGTADVTKFVSNRLIDLSHRAFVATFFTRQKELHFFGDVRDTDRRREVGKLLGLEHIRRAQMSIGEDRTAAARDAKYLREQYTQEIGERDLDAELAAIDEVIAGTTQQIEQARIAESAAIEATATARTQREAALALRDRHNEVRVSLERAQADQATADERHKQRLADIVRFEQLKAERETLLPVAAQADELREQVHAAELERERHRQRLQFEANLRTNQTNRANAVSSIARELGRIDTQDAPRGWSWTDADASNVTAAVARLHSVADAHSLRALEQRLDLLNRAIAASEAAVNEQAKLDKFNDLRNGLVAQRETLIKEGDPNQELLAIGESLTARHSELTAWNTERTSLETDLGKRQRVLDNIRESNFDDGCPTCGRKFSEHDEHDVTEIFSRDIATIHARIAEGDRNAQSIKAIVTRLNADRERQQERAGNLRKLDERIANSVGIIDEQTSTASRASEQAREILATANLTAPPTKHDIEQVEKQVILDRLIHQAIDRIDIHAGTVQLLDTDRATIESELRDLGDVTFDARAFDDLVSRRVTATHAVTHIEGLDRELERLPEAIADRDSLAADIEQTEVRIGELKQLMFEVGYDPELLHAASHALTAAEDAERAASQQRQQAELAHQRAESDKKAIEKDHERIRATVARADSRQREADELQQMYNLFGEFEQYVVSRLTPALSEMTSDLVRQVTDGRYDEVCFDDNFGIMVRDGDENPFPLATFSGGERDVIALCARLALSQMIGQQAAEQPGFLVLDEVFGSLDRSRRTRMLELFGNLSSVSDRFQQVFIISHVDDVRTAPSLDELWMVQASAEGKSTLQNLPPGTDIGEI